MNHVRDAFVAELGSRLSEMFPDEQIYLKEYVHPDRSPNEDQVMLEVHIGSYFNTLWTPLITLSSQVLIPGGYTWGEWWATYMKLEYMRAEQEDHDGRL